jgi:hypothetical protein
MCVCVCVCVCVCWKPQCLHETFFDVLNLFVLSGKCFANSMTALWSMLLTWATICCMLDGQKPYKHLHSGSWREKKELQWHFKHGNIIISLHVFAFLLKTLYSFKMLPFSCMCVLLRNYWTLLYVTWCIFHSDTFTQFIPSPCSYYIIHKIAIRFCHWSSRATRGNPASYYILYIFIIT